MDFKKTLEKDFSNFIKDKGILIDVDIPKISELPIDWEEFPGSKDLWMNLKFPKQEATTACLYLGRKNSVFKPHFHKNNTETCLILNEGGRIDVISEFGGLRSYEYLESFSFKKGEWHMAEFINETKILVIWNPTMTGFDVEYLKKNI